MAKKPARAGKSLTNANLTALGPDRLADLLLEAAAGDAAFKRRLRMELAAEVGAADLALEIDKRLATLATSRARVSWRKRPALLAELATLRRVVVERLAPLDASMALVRLVAWFDLHPGLTARVSDAKGELPLLFGGATGDLAALAGAVPIDEAAPLLADAVATRLTPWAAWIGQAAGALPPELAGRLVADLTRGGTPTGRLALVVRRLADRAGDLDAWLASLSADDRRKPEMAAEAARRLAAAGRPAEARQALGQAARSGASIWRRAEAETEAQLELRLRAEIAILEAEGRADEAGEARWSLFERTLSAEVLRRLLEGMPDFEDVIALDRAFALAAGHADVMRALAFLMDWPALREAAALVMARADEVRGAHDGVPLWASRLAGRHPAAALTLIRRRVAALMELGGMTDEVTDLLGEAEALATQAEGIDQSHEDFLRTLSAAGRRTRR